MLVASDQASSTFLDFAVFPLSRQKFSNLYEAERALALFLSKNQHFYIYLHELSFYIYDISIERHKRGEWLWEKL